MTINGEPMGAPVDANGDNISDVLQSALAAGADQGSVRIVPGGLAVKPLTDAEIADRKSENSLGDLLESIEDLAITCQDRLNNNTAGMISSLVDDLGKCPGEQIAAYIQRNTEKIRSVQTELSKLPQSQEVTDLNTAIGELLNQGN